MSLQAMQFIRWYTSLMWGNELPISLTEDKNNSFLPESFQFGQKNTNRPFRKHSGIKRDLLLETECDQAPGTSWNFD